MSMIRIAPSWNTIQTRSSKPGHKADAKLFRERFVTGFDGLVPLETLLSLAEEYKVRSFPTRG